MQRLTKNARSPPTIKTENRERNRKVRVSTMPSAECGAFIGAKKGNRPRSAAIVFATGIPRELLRVEGSPCILHVGPLHP